MLKQTIKKWNQSIDCYNSNQVSEAINLLTSVDATSKINYNIGVMLIKNQNYQKAVDYFSRSVELDKYLSVSYFMRGIAYHMSGDTSHAIVDYDEAINKLRGHEFIDYKQLGLESKLLLAEILYNKALALGKAGGPLAQQALSCQSQPSDLNFKDLCRKLSNGDIGGLQIRPIPLNLLFKPPKVSEDKNKSSPSTSSPVTSSPVSSSPPGSYTLRTKATTPPPSASAFSSTSTTTTTTSASTPPPLKPKPSAGSSIPKPPPLPSKKLPSRPISMNQQEEKITLKIFYTDRRLIQLTYPYTYQQLKQKIELKFEISLRNITIKYQSSDEQYYPITNQGDLDYAISYEINELHLFDGDESSNRAPSPPPVSSIKQVSSPTLKSMTTTTTTSSTLQRPKPTVPKTTFYNSASLTRSAANSLSKSAQTTPVSIPQRSYGKTVTSPLAASLPNKKFGGGGSSADETSSTKYKICFTPSGDKFYLNMETGETLWTTP
ncbi:p67-like superoxide-generating NADPH oxidase [Tieghemostelium lacteum]|uniref:p67-like superoxide-generating NADPH oxidase n=1 Tax=Tieghemostelium lacteum TaxID=361077 RepID=A0A151ZHK7_TIELA|nr:p67-like superoxide-generating NADPH oxidase [Tieghemostelium lacteum]|eukprot:KYQ93471.1 p67-like superoxide-generating NADPH oxidase [Tieghemostelium lacteum]